MESRQETACEAITAAGGPAKLAKNLLEEDHTKRDFLRMQRRISFWKRNGVAAQYVLLVEKFSNVSRHRLAPSLYPFDDLDEAV